MELINGIRQLSANLPIVFQHIPKSAGTSISFALANAIVNTSVETGFDRYLYGAFDRFDTFSPDARKSLHLSIDEMPNANFISGHYAFSTISTAYPNARYITVLREPKARLLSHWAFWRSLDGELSSVGAWATYVKKARNSLFDFLSDPEVACQTDNLATRALIWPKLGTSETRFIECGCDDRVLNVARSVIPSFSFVGLVEDDGLAANLSDWIGAQIDIPKLHETQAMPREVTLDLADELTPNSLNLLHQRTRLDQKLWMELAYKKFGDEASSIAEYTFIKSIANLTRLLLGKP